MKQEKRATQQAQQQASNRVAMSKCENHRKLGDGKTLENKDGKVKAVVLITEQAAQIERTCPSAKESNWL